MATKPQSPTANTISIHRKRAQIAPNTTGQPKNPRVSQKQRRQVIASLLHSLCNCLAVIPRVLKGNYFHLSAILLTTALFAVTVWFSQLSFPNSSQKGNSSGLLALLHFSPGLAILRTLQGATSTFTTFIVAQTFEILEWTFAKNKGLYLPTFLSLSPATSLLGLLKLGIGSKSRNIDRLWSFTRLISCVRVLLLLIIWLAGIVLFIHTSFGVVYELSETFNVTAGTGAFNGSFVTPTINSVDGTLSYWILATASTILNNPQFSTKVQPILCSATNSSCGSYLLPGGLQSISPNPPSSNSDPIVVVHESPGSQVEFTLGLDERDEFVPSDCVTYGDDKLLVGLQLCIAQSSVSNGSIAAGIFICSSGTLNGQCRDSGPHLNVSTTVTLFARQAAVTCARSNNSIISVSDLSLPSLTPFIDIPDLQRGLGWLLNYTAAGLPPESSITFLFWNHNAVQSEHDWVVDAYKTLQSILAFTTWFFTENNFGNPQMANPNASFNAQEEEYFLPIEYHTTASTAKMSTRFVIDKKMFAVYIVFQALPLIFCWVVLLWRIGGCLSKVDTSSFPILDFLFKAEGWERLQKKVDEENLASGERKLQKTDERSSHLEEASDRVFLEKLRDVEVAARFP